MPSDRSVSLLVKRNDMTLFLALRAGSGGAG
jgi:hypothetical protein